MLRRELCEVLIEWELTCEGPLLIADGRYDDKVAKNGYGGDEGSIPDKVFVSHEPLQTVYDKVRSSPKKGPDLDWYVPGTSLRGPLRSQAERIVRSLLPEDIGVPDTACDPFETEKGRWTSCSKRLDDSKPDVAYAEACPTCKLFGCTGTASRLDVTDAEIVDKGRSVYRDMIGIDRFTGGVHTGANMRFHAIEGARFRTTLRLRNFELWQLGLLAFTLRDFEEGRVPIGFGKTKGFGRARGNVTSARFRYPAGRCQGKVQHLGSLASKRELQHYGLRADAAPDAGLEAEGTAERLSLYEWFRLKREHLDRLWEPSAVAFIELVEERRAGGRTE